MESAAGTKKLHGMSSTISASTISWTRLSLPDVPDSDTPARVGGISLEKMRCLIDCGNAIYFIGEGGYKLDLSPGSFTLDLERSSGGYWMPCSQFETAGNPTTTAGMPSPS